MAHSVVELLFAGMAITAVDTCVMGQEFDAAKMEYANSCGACHGKDGKEMGQPAAR